MEAGLSPYVPRLLPELAEGTEGPLHRVIDGTLVFADLSGFTALSERLAAAGGKAGAEEMTVVLNDVFGALLDVASSRGGEMLKYGGDALLLLFRNDDHAKHAVTAAREMQRTLRTVGSIVTDVGRVRLRMSVGVHSGPIDFFVVGTHRELVVAGAGPSTTAAMETAADAGEILVSSATAALLPAYCVGDAKGDGALLRQAPRRVAPVGHMPRTETDLTGYIPDALRTTLLAGPVQPEHRPVAMGFVFVELPNPPELDALDTTFTRLVEIFASYDVTLMSTDLAAGGVKLIFAAGLPIAQPDAEERMLRAARDAIDAQLPLRLKIGVQRGHVFAGTVGPAYRMTFTVIGDVVNTAARLMARADFGEVLTLASVLEYSETEFAVEELAPFVAKGKAEPLIPFHVREPLRRRQRTDEILPIVGRDEQLAILDDALDAIGHGAGGSVEVVGDAGMGKTRLLDEFAGHAMRMHLGLVRSECSELDQARPYFVAERVLRPLLGVFASAELAELVAAKAPELADWLPLLGVPLGFDIEPTSATQQVAAGAAPGKIRELVVGLLEACVTTSTVMVVEDMHWADAPSQRLLATVAAAANAPLMTVISRRPVDLVAPFGDRASVTLAELSDSAAGHMLDRLAGRPLLPDHRATVLRRAAGNPLFLRELAVAIATGTDDELPDRVESLIEARIDRLDVAERIVLRAASVVGGDFSAAEVAAALEQPVAPTMWDRLANFVAPDSVPDRFRFRHALIRDSAYAGLPFRWRRTIHQRVGVFLEAQPDADAHTERLAIHFGVAGDRPRAWRYGSEAGQNARKRFAFAEAAGFFATALAYVDAEPDPESRFQVVDSHAYCLLTFGNLEGALEAIRAGRHLVGKDDAARARLHLQESICLLTMGDLAAAGKRVLSGLRLVADNPDALLTRVRLLAQRSRVAFGLRRVAEARRWAVAAAELAEAAHDKPGLAHALAAQYDAEAALRTPGRDEVGARARELFTELGQAVDAAVVLNLMGTDRQYSGDFNGAVAAFVEAETLQRAAGLQLHAAVSGHNRAYLLVKQGRLDEAAPLERDVMNVFAAAGYAAGRDAARCISAEIDALTGDASAVDALEALVEEAQSANREADAAEYAIVLAEASLVHQGVDRARTHLPDLELLAAPDTQARAKRLRAVVRFVETGDVAAAIEECDTLAAESEALDLPYEAAIARLLRAGISDDDPAPALAELERFGVVRVPMYDYLTKRKSA